MYKPSAEIIAAIGFQVFHVRTEIEKKVEAVASVQHRGLNLCPYNLRST